MNIQLLQIPDDASAARGASGAKSETRAGAHRGRMDRRRVRPVVSESALVHARTPVDVSWATILTILT